MTDDAHAPVALYRGTVFHARLRPVPHRFAYRVFSLLIDLDRLEEAGKRSRFFSVGKPNLASFHERDHGPCDGSSLRTHVDKLLKQRGIDVEGGRVLLLCYPRILGFAFNPLSVYYAFAADGRLAALVYEVRNTFGERHSYVAATRTCETGEALRHDMGKAFHVSPFLGPALTYRFRLAAPDDALRLLIQARDADGTVLAAGYAAQRHPLTDRTLVAALVAMPFMTVKVVAGILVEALRLRLKGLPVHPHPRRASPASLPAEPARTL
ncbi:MAG TPA: DUF1365 domain-containing protein [Microvirga sp.]|jgi:DUF1365 family protein